MRLLILIVVGLFCHVTTRIVDDLGLFSLELIKFFGWYNVFLLIEQGRLLSGSVPGAYFDSHHATFLITERLLPSSGSVSCNVFPKFTVEDLWVLVFTCFLDIFEAFKQLLTKLSLSFCYWVCVLKWSPWTHIFILRLHHWSLLGKNKITTTL